MENNIFFKNKKEKFNPDLPDKMTQKEQERVNTEFKRITTIYNPITNVIPTKINNQNDLKLKIDINNNNIQKMIQQKSNERSEQDKEFKPTKTKITPSTNTDSINTFDTLKKNSEVKNNVENTKKYNNILDSLKELGIITK
jgi:hypothetical protein